MRRFNILMLSLTFLASACGPVGSNLNGNNANVNWNQNNNLNIPDSGPIGGLVKMRGVVWSPGADQAAVLEVNRFPIPGAAVIAFHQPPEDLPQGMYCNECVEIPGGTPSVFTEIDGSFELELMPNQTYYLTIQKGEFRRVRQITVPDMPDEVWSLDWTPDQPRREELTLPKATDLALGDNVPKIAVISANYEDMDMMFEALGFVYDGVDIDEVEPSIVTNRAQLDQYNIVIVPCGENWPGGSGDVLKQWVYDGGKLYVDDFNYQFVEAPWPEMLSWYVADSWMGNSTGTCGEPSSPSTSVSDCNNGGSYDFNGDPGDPDFGQWLTLPEVNRGAGIYLEAAWDYIYALGEGIVGEDDECIGNCGPNGEVYMAPKVWMFNNDGAPFASHVPATVSWPYYCGKVLYTVYHTHSGYNEPYELLLQEKIMMYLIMEIQTCSTGPIVQ